jgi:hypothetical protein
MELQRRPERPHGTVDESAQKAVRNQHPSGQRVADPFLELAKYANCSQLFRTAQRLSNHLQSSSPLGVTPNEAEAMCQFVGIGKPVAIGGAVAGPKNSLRPQAGGAAAAQTNDELIVLAHKLE